MEKQDSGHWQCQVRLEKREGNIDACKIPEERLQFLKETKPYKVIEREGNLLLNEGVNALWPILCESTATEDRYTAASNEFNIQELGFKDRKDFEVRAKDVDREALEGMWH